MESRSSVRRTCFPVQTRYGRNNQSWYPLPRQAVTGLGAASPSRTKPPSSGRISTLKRGKGPEVRTYFPEAKMLSEADVISIAFDCTAHALSRSPRHGVTRDENIFLCASSKTFSFFHGFATPTSRGEERGSRELLRDVKTSFQTKVLLVQSRVKFTSTRSRAYESRVREANAERTADVTRTRRQLASVCAFARYGVQ